MEKSILIAGSGGHGVQTTGKTMVQAALMAGMEGTCLPKYGIEKRGGFSSCYLVISNVMIGNPRKKCSDVVVAIDERAYGLFSKSLKPGGILIIDDGIPLDKVNTGDDCQPFAIAAILKEAAGLGDLRTVSTIVTGLLMGIPGILPNTDEVREHICSRYSKKPEIAELNRKAFDIGLALGLGLNSRQAQRPASIP